MGFIRFSFGFIFHLKKKKTPLFNPIKILPPSSLLPPPSSLLPPPSSLLPPPSSLLPPPSSLLPPPSSLLPPPSSPKKNRETLPSQMALTVSLNVVSPPTPPKTLLLLLILLGHIFGMLINRFYRGMGLWGRWWWKRERRREHLLLNLLLILLLILLLVLLLLLKLLLRRGLYLIMTMKLLLFCKIIIIFLPRFSSLFLPLPLPNPNKPQFLSLTPPLLYFSPLLSPLPFSPSSLQVQRTGLGETPFIWVGNPDSFLINGRGVYSGCVGGDIEKEVERWVEGGGGRNPSFDSSSSPSFCLPSCMDVPSLLTHFYLDPEKIYRVRVFFFFFFSFSFFFLSQYQKTIYLFIFRLSMQPLSSPSLSPSPTTPSPSSKQTAPSSSPLLPPPPSSISPLDKDIVEY